MSSGVILLQKPYISFSSPLLLILRRKITAAAVALFEVTFIVNQRFKEPWTIPLTSYIIGIELFIIHHELYLT